MRRRFDEPNTFWDVKYPRADAATDAIAAFDDFLSDLFSSSGADLEEKISNHLDLDRYLRWIALMTAYANGDYVDEMFVFSTEQHLEEGAADWFELMAWDNDDLFSECHYSGRYAVKDSYQLVYCAEAELDHLILKDSVIYDRYVDVLRKLLTEQVTVERFEAALRFTENQLLPFLEEPEIRSSMYRKIGSDSGFIEQQAVSKSIRTHLDTLASEYARRRELLLDRIATYKEEK